MRIRIPLPETNINAVLSAGRERIEGEPSVNYLRVPDGPGPGTLPGIWYACPPPGMDWIDLFDGRVAGLGHASYLVGIWSAKRQQLLVAHHDLMLWLTGWQPYDLLDEFQAELGTAARAGANLVGDLAAALGTARVGLAAAVGLEAQLSALTALQDFGIGSLIPAVGDDTAPALAALAALRTELPVINFTMTPLRTYDQLLSGWTDHGVYGRVTVVEYQENSSSGG